MCEVGVSLVAPWGLTGGYGDDMSYWSRRAQRLAESKSPLVSELAGAPFSTGPLRLYLVFKNDEFLLIPSGAFF